MNNIKQVTQHKYLSLLLLSALLSSCDNSKAQNETQTFHAENPVISAKQSASSPVAEKAAKPTIENPSQNTNDSLTAEDITNLTRAMSGGAVGIMPEDAPKDKYNLPYIIGNLGGVPVNLSRTIAMFVEYENSQRFNQETRRDFKPIIRNYNSVIRAFGFEFRLRDGLLLDRNNEEAVQARKESIEKNDFWVKVSIMTKREDFNPNFLDKYVKDSKEINHFNPRSPLYDYWESTGETYYGLAVYTHPGIDAKTGKLWQEHKFAEDQFVFSSTDGRVQTVIRCSNQKAINICHHYFNFPEPMKIRIEMWYRRELLLHWQKIEQLAIQSVLSFRKN